MTYLSDLPILGALPISWYTRAISPKCQAASDSGVVRVMRKPASDKSYELNCEICGATMIERNCKIRCPNCGFTRDCSDP